MLAFINKLIKKLVIHTLYNDQKLVKFYTGS